MFRFYIKETKEYERLKDFMIPFGLEFSNDEELETEIIKCWKVIQEPDYLVGAVMLGMRKGYYYINGIAVDPPMRHTGIATIMMKKAISEVRKMGGHELWLVAKVPEFFSTLGFVTVEPEDAPSITGCTSCEQYGSSCKPEIMKLVLEK